MPERPPNVRTWAPQGDTDTGDFGDAAGHHRRLRIVPQSAPSMMPAAMAMTFFKRAAQLHAPESVLTYTRK